jgi:hypothetical protein
MKAFISYAHRDRAMLERLHTHLAMLRREGGITDWYDREILAGTVIAREIPAQLEDSRLFLALVSPDFLSSQYCYEKEMTHAIERHEAGQIVIVPVILEPCDWLSSPLQPFKALPGDGKPISEWTNQNAAFLDVVSELRRLVSAMSPSGATPPTPDQPASRQPPGTSRYRIRKTFDRIDRDDFRAATYETIRKYFEESAKELDGVDDLRARYQTTGPTAFTCTVVNRLIKNGPRGEAHITVHASPGAMLGDIYYSFAPSAAENRANGSFGIEYDDYHLFLRASSLSSANDNRNWYPQEVAARLWQEFLQQAGISYNL